VHCWGAASWSNATSSADLNAVLASLLAKVAELQAQIAQLGTGGGTLSSGDLIIMNLFPGYRGSQVEALQSFLIDLRLLAEGNISGVYGPLTTAAVKAFQRSQGIVKSGSPTTTGYGAVGPQTRTAINSLTQ
jgi:peptidoglycan hydrolase-like protein with peptidoglycan-binding domain